MRFIPSLLLALMLSMGYFLFFRAQAESARPPQTEAPKSAQISSHPTDPYKAAMDRGHLAAGQMISARDEAEAAR